MASSPPHPPDRVRVGQALRGGRYLLVAPLGAGGQATVWRARDSCAKAHEADVALKLLPADDGGAEAAAREAEVAIRVQHPNVVRVRDSFTDGPWAVIVMELALCSMAELVEERGPLPPEALLDVGIQVCAGLAAAHSAGVVHRDVKPHNLLLFPGGVVKLGDFGVARAEGHTRTRTAHVLGSLPFMAPEQRRDPRAVRPATDVYGLALTLAWLHFGRPSGDLYAPGGVGELVEAGMPVALAEALGRAGSYGAQDRFLDGQCFADAIAALGGSDRAWLSRAASTFGQERPATATEDPPAPVGQGAPSRSPLGLALLIGCVALAVLLAGRAGTDPGEAGRAAGGTASATAAPPPLCEGEGVWKRWQYPRSSRHKLGLVEAGLPAIADLDVDGYPDLAFPHQEGETIRIFWGDPELGFADEPTDLASGRLSIGTTTLAAGDVTGDGLFDLVGFQREAGRVAILPGKGGRTFGAAWDIGFADAIWNLALVDWDRDGVADVLLDGGPVGEQLFWFRGGPTLGDSAPQRLRSGSGFMSPLPDGRGILRLVGTKGSTGYSLLEHLEPSGVVRTETLPMPLERVSRWKEGHIGQAMGAGQHLLLRFRAGALPCQIPMFDAVERSAWAVAAGREVIAGSLGSAYTTSTYAAHWR